MNKLFLLSIFLCPLLTIAEDTPNNFQPTPSWLSQTRQAVKSEDFLVSFSCSVSLVPVYFFFSSANCLA
jgi:hypothetical protein